MIKQTDINLIRDAGETLTKIANGLEKCKNINVREQSEIDKALEKCKLSSLGFKKARVENRLFNINKEISYISIGLILMSKTIDKLYFKSGCGDGRIRCPPDHYITSHNQHK